MKYPNIRTGFLTFILGLVSIPFFNDLYDEWTEIKVDLPQTQSASPILVVPENSYFYTDFPFKNFTDMDFIQKRDLSQYESGGEFSNCANLDIRDIRKCLKQQSAARIFLSHHLMEKKRGYILYEWTGIDTGSTTHIFVEPDERGKWSIILRSAGDYRYQNLEEKRAYSAKYKRAKSDDDYPFRVGTYFLTLLDESEKEIERF